MDGRSPVNNLFGKQVSEKTEANKRLKRETLFSPEGVHITGF